MNELVKLMESLQNTISNSLTFFFGLTFFLFAILVLFRATHPYMSLLGIIPRQWFGLPGILSSPFIHANFNHLFFNLIPLLVLSAFLMVWGFDFYWNLTWLLIIISGFLIWCFARPGVHIGASALITAYWGFLVTVAVLGGGNIYNYFVGFICIYYFFGIFFGIFPREQQVSWEGHLLGLLSGVGLCLAAFYIPIVRHAVLERPFLIGVP